MSDESDGIGSYRSFLSVTICIVCLLILVGGIVRSTGSGMGCPDWPKCFGQWVPPNDISQLPVDYKETYSEGRHKKNLRAASYLEVLGFSEVAHKLRTDKSILVEETFNAKKTWIEYMNRLLGVITGLFIFLNVIFAFRLRRSNKRFLTLAGFNLVLVGFQGWVGSIVVSTNLLSGMITFHMILALIILAVLILNYWVAKDGLSLAKAPIRVNKIFLFALLALGLFTVQVVFGTQVREGIDRVAKLLGESQRDAWISHLGADFYIHRSYSILILLVHGYFGYLIIKQLNEPGTNRLVHALYALLAVEVISGIIMAYMGIPAFFQPIHLLLATLIFGLDFYLLLVVNHYRKAAKITEVEVTYN